MPVVSYRVDERTSCIFGGQSCDYGINGARPRRFLTSLRTVYRWPWPHAVKPGLFKCMFVCLFVCLFVVVVVA